MGELTLVRHGQANTGAQTEADYDKLSERGWEQSRRLGAWMAEFDAPFDLVLAGGMRRHRETAEGMGVTAERFDERLNEMEYFALARDMEITHGVTPPKGPDDFAAHMPQTMAAWEAATINGAESFATFETRILSALAEASEPGKRVLCVTSGGVISMVMRSALGLSTLQMSHVLLPIFNTSLHRFRIREEGMFLTGYNATPHLDGPHATLKTNL